VAQLSLWDLPLNPPNPYPFYLQYLTPEREGKLYYTKYILNVIGELDVTTNTNNVREWEIPPTLLGGGYLAGNPIGITYAPDGKVWFALENSNRLVKFDPASGVFTAFFGSLLPIPYPRHLMFQKDPVVWYTGSGTNGALIGRLDLATQTATYWDLPIEFLTPEGLWVEDDGKSVWFTPINPNAYMTGAFLARLGGGRLQYWTFPSPGRRPVNAGVAAEPSTNPENVWFSYDAWGSSSRVFRLNLPSRTFFEYEPTFSAPRKIALDARRNAWISDWSGKVSMITADADCGTTKFPSKTIRLRGVDMQVKSQEQAADPVVSSVPPTKQQVSPQKDNCYRHYPLPPPLASNGIHVTGAGRKTVVYFSQGSGRTIGQLIP
jgi:streptogramin lyase